MSYIKFTLASNGKEIYIHEQQIASFHTMNDSREYTVIILNSAEKFPVEEKIDEVKRLLNIDQKAKVKSTGIL